MISHFLICTLSKSQKIYVENAKLIQTERKHLELLAFTTY